MLSSPGCSSLVSFSCEQRLPNAPRLAWRLPRLPFDFDGLVWRVARHVNAIAPRR
jgi:hypothetical protein